MQTGCFHRHDGLFGVRIKAAKPLQQLTGYLLVARNLLAGGPQARKQRSHLAGALRRSTAIENGRTQGRCNR